MVADWPGCSSEFSRVAVNGPPSRSRGPISSACPVSGVPTLVQTIERLFSVPSGTHPKSTRSPSGAVHDISGPPPQPWRLTGNRWPLGSSVISEASAVYSPASSGLKLKQTLSDAPAGIWVGRVGLTPNTDPSCETRSTAVSCTVCGGDVVAFETCTQEDTPLEKSGTNPKSIDGGE